jgi:hypothetical protein
VPGWDQGTEETKKLLHSRGERKDNQINGKICSMLRDIGGGYVDFKPGCQGR